MADRTGDSTVANRTAWRACSYLQQGGMVEERGEDGKWTPWFGGACPVMGDTLVHARLRYSGEVTAPARDLRWRHDLYVAYGAEEVVAYRLC
ncbi:hypothetical protein I5E68_16730 [Novosphingobium sp. YJ-S2-02]|uniref:Uncharacterized protein n=1 Tax=Novosphingobium aureum TaxID=2792964 RepID=A0A931MMN7_9SPHN|nr:hypothetical protein [Novosphingobium aureum]MBH0114595.1 hypothetical protein [Novosphingobium aureum]